MLKLDQLQIGNLVEACHDALIATACNKVDAISVERGRLFSSVFPFVGGVERSTFMVAGFDRILVATISLVVAMAEKQGVRIGADEWIELIYAQWHEIGK